MNSPKSQARMMGILNEKCISLTSLFSNMLGQRAVMVEKLLG